MSRFATYATGVAFRIDLTKAQVKCLNHFLLKPGTEKWIRSVCWDKITEMSLHTKGLIDFCDEAPQGIVLTPEGAKVLELLDLAGTLVKDDEE